MKHYETNFNYWNKLIQETVDGADKASEQINTIALALANNIKLKDNNPDDTNLRWNFK